MDTVNGFCGNIHCAMETKSHICPPDIIIYGLGKIDNVQSLFSEHVCRLLGTVAAQDHQTVKTQLIVRLLHGFNLVKASVIGHTHQFKGLAGCTQDRTASCEDT